MEINQKRSIEKRFKRNKLSLDKKLEKDLRDCMHCKFFYGNSIQCAKSQCVKEELKTKPVKTECTDCPYSKGHELCFPCMKKLLDKRQMH